VHPEFASIEPAVLHSVGKREEYDSRETPPTADGARAEIGTVTGRVAKALRSAGIAHVNPSHPALIRLIDAGVTLAEFNDAASEAMATGKGKLAYVCAVIEGRRRDAAQAGTVSPPARPPPQARSGAHRPYVPDRRPRRDPTAPEPQPLKDILARLGVARSEASPADVDAKNRSTLEKQTMRVAGGGVP
jgi:hypothetical protein